METRSIDFVAEQLRRCRDLGRKATLIAGPSCSLSGGIPDANGWIELIRARFPEAIASIGEPPRTVASCLAAIGPGHARALVEEVVAAARVNPAHDAIAELVRAGYVDRVLTPNFDNLILRACVEKGIFPAVYDAAAAERLDLPEPAPSPSIVHLQGQRSGFVLLDHDEAIRLHEGRLAPLFRRESARSHPWIVVGYAGGAGDPLLASLASVGVFEYHLFFVAEGDAPLDAEVVARLGHPKTRSVAVAGFTADAFLESLARRLAVPAVVAEPEPAPREVNGHGPVIPVPIEKAETPPPPPPPEAAPAPPVAIAEPVHRTRSLLERVARETAEIAEAAVDPEPPNGSQEESESEPVAALLEKAMSLAYAARERFGNGESARLYEEAEALFDAAAHAEEDGSEALDRWGALLLERAKTANVADERDRLFAAAKEKCSAANAQHRGRGSYNLACIAALRGRSGEARDWLEVGAESGTLPERRHLLADTDLDPVRNEPWFALVLSRATGL